MNSPDMAIAMFLLLVTWLASVMIFLGIGLLARAAIVGKTPPNGLEIFSCIWCGFAFSISFLQIWHLAMPVGVLSTVALAATGMCGIIASRSVLLQVIRRAPAHKLLIVAIVIFAVWAANRGLGQGGYDDLRYEYHSVHWIGNHAIVPGIGNLNQRLGFNNAHHLLAASINLGPLIGRVHHALLGVFVCLAAAQVLWSTERYLKDNRPRSSNLFTMTFAAPCLIMMLFGMFGPSFSTLKADILVIAASLASVSLLVYFGDPGDDELAGNSPRGKFDFILFTVIIMGAAMVTIKLSALIFSMGLMVAAVLIAIKRNYQIRRFTAIAAFSVASLLLATWLVRGGIISGYPLYPSRAITLPVSWRVPPEVADGERLFIQSWGRDAANPTRDAMEFATKTWFVPWLCSILANDKFTTVLPAVLLLVAAPFGILGGMRRQDRSAVLWTLSMVVVVSVASIIFWFVSAPTTRFGYGFFWVSAAAMLAMALPTLNGGHSRSVGRSASIAIGTGVLTLIAAGVATLLPFAPGTKSGFLVFAGFAAIVMPLLCFAVSLGSKKMVLAGMCVLGVSPLLERCSSHIIKGRGSELVRFLFVPPATILASTTTRVKAVWSHAPS